ncbi:hypothetical protein M0812_05888 [Anaeramoeba flamelloides]|uniref:Reverse transcriptase domain-containing protein n=1 Tax=Anaeramoeba flamelloides TaxID=1746091 RepID=A0AAV8A658_9EUKA|nr:hypothetical protein M0812_05888 [Anaeramoeba flamelloides]
MRVMVEVYIKGILSHQLFFAYITHFILERIKPHTNHVQMYADDLIIILNGKDQKEIINNKLKPIYKIIKNFGLKVNEKKTEITQDLSSIKYLGIWLEKEKHIKMNLQKASINFSNYYYIYCNSNLSNALRIQLFKSIILPQILYGLDIYNLNNKEIKTIDIWINKKLKCILKIQHGTPTDILRMETRIEPIQFSILKRKAKFIQKISELNLKYLSHELKLPDIPNINWRYSYHLDKPDSSKDCHCKNDQDETIDHFIWDCPKYKKSRSIWKAKLGELKSINRTNLFNQKDTYLIFRLMNNKEIYEISMEFFLKNLKIRAIINQNSQQ